LFRGEFSQPGDGKKRKKRLANPTKGFLGIFFKESPYLEGKNKKKARSCQSWTVFLQVAKTRQDSKKDLLVHQDSRHLLPINAEGISQCTYLRNLRKKKPFLNLLLFFKKNLFLLPLYRVPSSRHTGPPNQFFKN
jgi:hypothetical protein